MSVNGLVKGGKGKGTDVFTGKRVVFDYGTMAPPAGEDPIKVKK